MYTIVHWKMKESARCPKYALALNFLRWMVAKMSTYFLNPDLVVETDSVHFGDPNFFEAELFCENPLCGLATHI